MAKLKIETTLKNIQTSFNTDRSDLGKLYPDEKTYEQVQQDNVQRQEMYKARLPKYVQLKLSAFGALAVGATALFLQNLEKLWMTGSSGMIFLSFAVALVLFFGVYAWVVYTNRRFYVFGKSPQVFWISYGVAMTVAVCIWTSGWVLSAAHLLWVPILMTFQFLVTFVGSLYLKASR